MAALALLGAGYGVILAVDDPALDERSVVVGAALLAIGELSYLALETRRTVTSEDGVGRRVGWVAVAVMLALLVGAVLLAVVDLVRTGGLAVDALGAAAAAAAAVGLLVLAGREARTPSD